MENLIALFISIVSGAGVGIIIRKKIPLLLAIPRKSEAGLGDLWMQSIAKIKESRAFPSLMPEKILQKTLSKTQVLAMKTEVRTGEWLQQLRKRAQERKEKFTQTYWDQFRKRTSRKAGE